MRRYYLQSGLWMSVLTVLIFGGLYVAADLNAIDRPSNALNIEGEFWSDKDPGFALDKISARSTKIALGPNANATVTIDLITDGGSGNQMDDGVTSGTVSGQGTKIAVEVFAKGVATPLNAVIIKFNFDASVLKVEKVENSAFSPILDGKGATFLALSPVTLPPSGFLARAEFSTVTDVTGQAFTLGIGTVSLQTTTSKDDVTTTDVISFNANNANPSPDFDGNGVVGIPDFLQFVDHFGTSRGGAGYDAKYDLDGNDTIGVSDFLIFVDSFGKAVSPSGGGGGGSSIPDLIVESPSVSDSTLTPGQSFTLSATVRNRGTGSSAATTLRYYRSSNSTISTSDTQVGTDSVSGLSASGTSAESISLNAPSSAGTYYYGACVNSVTGESDTGNNCSDAVTVTVSSSSGSGGGGGGSSNTYSVGESLPNFPSGFFVPAQVSGGSFQFSQGRAVLGFRNGGLIKLQDGTTYTCIASGGCDVEGGRVTKGTIRVTTGSSGGGGNSGSPDLIVESPSVSDSTLTTGQSFTLSATVRNQGTGSSAATTLRYYRSSNSTISTSDTQVGTDSVNGLSASGTSAESISLNAPSSAGTYYYGACVNSVTGESDTGNNCSDAVTVTVSSSSGGGGGGGGGSGGGGATVTIPDANLRAVITDSLGKSRNASITRAEMATLTRIDAPRKGIRNLTGLEHATNLTRLSLSLNSISDISALSNLTNLEWLGLDGTSNSISDISGLSNLTNLEWLALSNNSISDISALSNLTNLERLYLDGNSISDISGLSNLTNLERLGLDGTSISDISALSNLTNLESLDLTHNSISDISALSNLTSLEWLTLWNNSISDISALSNLTSLEWLSLSNNSISDISPLVANTGLGSGDSVYLRSNPLSSTSINTHIPALQRRGVTVGFDSSSGSGGGGGTSPPSGDAVTGSITDCSGAVGYVFISGTVRANRSVSNLVLTGYIGNSWVGRTSLGFMSAGQSKDFTITGLLGAPSGRCRVEMTWIEGGNKSQSVVDEQ